MNLIHLSDIREFWPISLNMEDNRIAPHVARAQEANLQSLISPQVYFLLLNNFVRNFVNPNFETLKEWSQSALGTQWTALPTQGTKVVLGAAGSSAYLFQEINAQANVPVTVKLDLDVTAADTIFELIGANQTDLSDAVVLGTINPVVDGLNTVTVTPLVKYRYIGFRFVSVAASTVMLGSVSLHMADRFDKLWNGEPYKYGSNYDQKFPGIRQLLCAYSYDNVLSNNQIHVTRGGVNKKIGEQTENATDKNVSVKSSEAYSEAIRLEGQFFQWISQKNAAYPEYSFGKEANHAQPMFYNASRSAMYHDEWERKYRH